MQRGKKGQVTVFIILGIILLIIAGILVYIYTTKEKDEAEIEIYERLDSASLEPIKELIKTCTKESLEEGIIKIGLQGGYYDPAQYVQLGNYSVSYAYINSQNRLPTLYQISREIEQYSISDEAQEEIDTCINDFENFKRSFDMDYDDYEVKVGEISETSIPIEIIYPIDVSKGDVTLQIDKVAYTIKSGIGTAYKVAAEIVNDEASEGTFNIDDYIVSNPPLAMIERQKDDNNLFYYLESISQETEPSTSFHFIIEK